MDNSAIDHQAVNRLRAAEMMKTLDSRTIGKLSMAIELRNKAARSRMEGYEELVEAHNDYIKRLLGL